MTNNKIEDIKDYLMSKKVLFMTNATALPCTSFVASLKTYIDYIPVHNFWMCPGIDNNKPNYGIDVFMDLTARAFSDRIIKKFDYVVYIDVDCFICDFEALYKQLKLFIEKDSYCIAGPQDGGVFCHRNHSRRMINTFLSFWNIKKMRELSTPEEFIQNVNAINKQKQNELIAFNNIINQKNAELSEELDITSLKKNKMMRIYREDNYHTELEAWKALRETKTDEDKELFTCAENNGEMKNYEPYYVVEQAYVLCTSLPIMYFSATDYYNEELSDEETDNSGITSVVLSEDMTKTIALHTWFGSVYNIHPTTETQLEQTKRIHKIVKLIDKK